ncbi:MAG: type II toxin-antitoxin system HicA family toxin [Clostridia bacterium]|nr:type II toxin-antitoxin system HicA family toxin [Clostridia bacterium]
MSFKRIRRMLEENGWQVVRVCGSHYQFKHAAVRATICVPNHGSRDISIGVIKSLERATGLSLRG